MVPILFHSSEVIYLGAGGSVSGALKPNQNCGCPGAFFTKGALVPVGNLVGLRGPLNGIGMIVSGSSKAFSLIACCSSGK